MTSIVAVACSDGVVVGTDSSSTFTAGQNFRTVEQPTEKLQVVSDEVIIAGTGQVGLGQRFGAVVEAKWPSLRGKTAIEAAKGFTVAGIQDFAETRAPQGQYGAIVAFPCRDEAHLCEFAITDFQPELKTQHMWYVSMGSAQAITDPFLGFLRDIFWANGRPPLQEGIFSVVWTLEEAVRMNPGGVNAPIRLAVLEKTPGKKDRLAWQARRLAQGELDLHSQNVAEAREHLRQFRRRSQPGASTAQPPILETGAASATGPSAAEAILPTSDLRASKALPE